MGGQEAGSTNYEETPKPEPLYTLDLKEHQYSFDSIDIGGVGPDTQKAMSRNCINVPVEKIKNLKPE